MSNTGGSAFGSGLGSTLSGASSLLGSLFGTGTTVTDANGEATTNSKTNQSSTTTGEQKGTSSSTTVGTADPEALATARSLTATALAKMNDPKAINDLITSTLNDAAVTYGETTAGASRGSGLYNSSTQTLLKGYAKAQAITQSLKAILDYQTQQEQLAINSNNSVIDATKGTTTSSVTDQVLNSATVGSANTSGTTTNKSTSSSGNGGLLGSVICTELHTQGRLDTRLYRLVTVDFQRRIGNRGRQGYYFWARYCVKHLQNHPRSGLSKVIEYVVKTRAKHVVGVNRSLSGLFCTFLVASLSAISYYLFVAPKGVYHHVFN